MPRHLECIGGPLDGNHRPWKKLSPIVKRWDGHTYNLRYRYAEKRYAWISEDAPMPTIEMGDELWTILFGDSLD